MKRIRVLIVDDEGLARDTLRLLLEASPEIEIVGACENGREAVAAIDTLQPELVFLDIQMPEMNGFEVIEAVGIDKMPLVVFVTAYDQYALQAFDAQALDYLLKPFDDDRFEQALSRAVDRVRQREAGDLSQQLAGLLSSRTDEVRDEPASARIMIKNRDTLYFVKAEEIDWVEAAGDYVALHVGAKSHLLRETMGRMEKRLGSRHFVRIHRSSIVNIDRIKEITPYFHGDYIVRLHTGKELRLSRRYWDRVEQVLGT